MANLWSKKRKFKPKDFMPQVGGEEKHQTVEEQMRAMDMKRRRNA
jgi:hypothetical protein